MFRFSHEPVGETTHRLAACRVIRVALFLRCDPRRASRLERRPSCQRRVARDVGVIVGAIQQRPTTSDNELPKLKVAGSSPVSRLSQVFHMQGDTPMPRSGLGVCLYRCSRHSRVGEAAR